MKLIQGWRSFLIQNIPLKVDFPNMERTLKDVNDSKTAEQPY